MAHEVVIAASQLHYLRALWRVAKCAGWPVVALSADVARAAKQLDLRLVEDDGNSPVICAAFNDAVMFGGRRIGLFEHGAGQRYIDCDHPSYAGGRDRRRIVEWFFTPTDDVWAHDGRGTAVGYPPLDGARIPVVPGRIGFTWHWHCRVSVEAGTAMGECVEQLPELIQHLTDAGHEVVGHHHPRNEIAPVLWQDLGVPVVKLRDLLASEVVVVDNSSVGCEAMWLQRRVIWISSKRWRRDVVHGRRFWEWPSASAELVSYEIASLPDLLAEPYDFVRARGAAELSLGQVEGSTQRAVAAVRAWLENRIET